MKVDKKDEYFAFQSKLIRRVCMNVITSIVVVVGLYLFIWKQRIGDLIVWILETAGWSCDRVGYGSAVQTEV